MDYLYLIIALLIIYLLKQIFNGPTTKASKDMNGKVVVITGASAGIGKETARDLLIKGATVIFASRDENKTLSVINQIVQKHKIPSERALFIKLDLSSLNSVSQFVHKVKHNFNKIDILINNAGVFSDKYIKTEDEMELNFQTNHLSHVLITLLLFDMILESSDGRIINVGSLAHKYAKFQEEYFKFDSKGFSMTNSYACSKVANLYFTWALRDYCIKKNYLNIRTAILHPGAVFTEMPRLHNRPFLFRILGYLLIPLIFIFFKDEKIGAQTTLHLCYIDNFEFVNGGFYQNCKLSKLDSFLNNKELQDRINKATYKFIKFSPVTFEKNVILNDFLEFLNSYNKIYC